MIGRFIRVIFGFALACLAAGLTMVLFVYAPFEATDLQSERMTEIGLMSLAAATHSAVFSAPFGLVGAVFGEWQRIGSWFYYLFVAIFITAIGFVTQFWSEAAGAAANSYAVMAFAATAFVSSVVYWLFSGRFAAGPSPIEPSDIVPPPRRAPSPDGPPARAAT
jgi:hypothetical protein